MKTDLDTLLIALYVLIDDHVIPPQRRRAGRPKKLADAELVCLAVAQVLVGARSEHHWLRMCYGRLGHLFPYLPTQPGYPKRLKAATPLICRTMLSLATLCPSWIDDLRLVDATPVPCGASRETVRRSEVTGWAGYGYCAARSRWYWGLKRYLITTAEGMPVAWCLAAPNLGEREVAQELVGPAGEHGALRPGMILVADKGLSGKELERLSPTRSASCWSIPTAPTPSNAATATSLVCASGSKRSTTRAKASSTSKTTAGALPPGSPSASPSACWPWPPRSGTTGRSTHPSNAR